MTLIKLCYVYALLKFLKQNKHYSLTIYRDSADFQPMIQQVKNNREKVKTLMLSEKEDDIELKDHAVASEYKRCVFSILKPSVLQRLSIEIRSFSH